jgi:hypothetical protein
MSNPYYTYSGAFIPGILARAEAEATEFQAVQLGFALLATNGTDSGAANAYVVATQGGQNGVYTDGMVLQFKAMNANTGASTISVDSGNTVALTDFQGQSLAGGAIKANSWVRLTYNSTFSAWTLMAPTSQVITSNTISASAPTNKVGLTAAGGSSLACAPIDVTFAIDQSIAPTWTGIHTFSNTTTFSAAVNFSTGVSFTGAANQFAATFTGSSSSGQSYGIKVNGGTTAGDDCAIFNDRTGATQYLLIQGAGSVLVGSPTGGGQGVGTINAQGLYVNGVAVSNAVSANPGTNIGLSVVNGTATTYMRSDGAPALSQAIAPTWTAAHTFTPGAGIEPIRVNLAANARGLVMLGGTNTSNHYMMEMDSAQAAGFSSGVLIQAATNASDAALNVVTATGTSTALVARGDSNVYTQDAAGTLQVVGSRNTPINGTNDHTLTLADRGRVVVVSSGTGTITIPSGTFSAGDVVAIKNIISTAGTAVLIKPGAGVNLIWQSSGSGSAASTGNRTLAGCGMAVIAFDSSGQCTLHGNGIA